MKLKLILICFIGTLFSMQAQTSVKPVILEILEWYLEK
jgi:hypothetical protein